MFLKSSASAVKSILGFGRGVRISTLSFDLGQCAEDLPQIPTRAQRFRCDLCLLQTLTRLFNLSERSLRPRQNAKHLWNELAQPHNAQLIEQCGRKIEGARVIILRDDELEFPEGYVDR